MKQASIAACHPFKLRVTSLRDLADREATSTLSPYKRNPLIQGDEHATSVIHASRHSNAKAYRSGCQPTLTQLQDSSAESNIQHPNPTIYHHP
jgi:hypothetical protein